jgi:hypothetical protein
MRLNADVRQADAWYHSVSFEGGNFVYPPNKQPEFRLIAKAILHTFSF